MKALILQQIHQPLEYGESTDPVGNKETVVVKLMAAAVNHRDVFITQGLYAGIQTPVILGSDGAGEYRGRRVLLYPALEWGDQTTHQGKRFRVLGMPENGTFAEQIAISRKNLFPMPEHLDWQQGAALPLAGLTAWRALFSRCRLKKGEKVLITGIGGGVALMALQFALAAGAEVTVTSGSDEKLEKARTIGAHHTANYREEDWDKRLKKSVGAFDVIIDSAAGDAFSLLVGLASPGARIGIYGGTLGKVGGLSLQPVFWKQISILGSTMGSPQEFGKMLKFVGQHRIITIVDSVFDLKDGNAGLERMDKGEQFGKIVFRV
ncbi:MAG TPA: zinc-binding dehydrogenase [Saprospiraceae bacterium]|nr:zinc-binding dehydrogenase [Saprospiraceae bacterium]HPI05018.1 zinc-binding dehydrogenase [Saprospiraceae bacterium]